VIGVCGNVWGVSVIGTMLVGSLYAANPTKLEAYVILRV
jgi:hypothetical protein